MTAICAFCLADVSTEEIFRHLRDEHDLDFEPETWPGGEVVVIDMTLEPEDFA